MSTMQPPLASPCINICRLNDDQMCIGCGRSSHEITVWSQLTDAQRSHLMATILPARLESLFD